MKDLTSYATATATPTMEAFADYLIAEVFGGSLPNGPDLASFRKGVALGGSTRGYFQASETWKRDARNYKANVEANREAKAIAKADAAKVALAKATARVEAAEAKAAEAVEAAKARLAALATEEPTEESAEESAEESEEVPAVREEGSDRPTRRSRRAA